MRKSLISLLFFVLFFYNCREVINLSSDYKLNYEKKGELIFILNDKRINLDEICYLGTIFIDEKKEVLFKIKNCGDEYFKLKEIKVDGDDSKFFTIIKKPDDYIDIDSTTDFIVEFKGEVQGEKKSTIFIYGEKNQYIINLKANLLKREPEFIIENPSVSPQIILTKDIPQNIFFTLYVEKKYGAIIDSVILNLSSINGEYSQNMYDDGTNGDILPNDNIYSYSYFLNYVPIIDNYSMPVVITGNASEKRFDFKIKITNLLFLNSNMESNVYNIPISGFNVSYIEENAKEGNRAIRIYGNTGNSNMDIFKVSSLCNSKGNLNRITFFLKGESTKGLVLRIGANDSNYFNINNDTKNSLINLSSSPVYSNKSLNISDWLKIELDISTINPESKQFILRGGANGFYDIYIDYIIYE